MKDLKIISKTELARLKKLNKNSIISNVTIFNESCEMLERRYRAEQDAYLKAHSFLVLEAKKSRCTTIVDFLVFTLWQYCATNDKYYEVINDSKRNFYNISPLDLIDIYTTQKSITNELYCFISQNGLFHNFSEYCKSPEGYKNVMKLKIA